MNKKRLSVVMAGAMLATSVAPVLAAETTGTEIAYNQLATFKSDLLAKMSEKKISKYTIFTEADYGFIHQDIETDLTGIATNEFASAYGIKVTGKDGRVKTDTTYKSAEVKTALANLKSGDKVEVYERETTSFKGQLIPGKGLDNNSELVASTYVASDFTTGSTTTESQLRPDSANNKMVTNISTTADGTTLTLGKHVSVTDSTNQTLALKVDDTRLDGRLPLDADGNLLDFTNIADVEKFDKFENYYNNWKPCEEAKDKGAKVIETYTIGEETADETKETLKASDLYDGLALTARGTEISADYKNANEAAAEEGIAENNGMVRISAVSSKNSTGTYNFTVTYYKNADKNIVEKTITVVSADSDEINAVQKLLKGTFNVGVVAGQNRYETAVNVAKQQNIDIKTKKNIVLVNGESLVDGLSAAPLAAEKEAPLLLTKSDKLATETKEYLESKIESLNANEKKAITVHLVGGSSVLETSLIKELKDMGLKTVVRHGGDNREETSVAVAKALTKNVVGKAFVVGANGEADAMSIAAVASDMNLAQSGAQVAPIIVAKAGGISDSALDYLEEADADDVTIIGGTAVVSEKEEDKINKSLKTAKAMRIAGENRIETNNAIIKEFYKGTATGVVVVKDGIANKTELVDALSAANYAAVNKAPIVLATNKVTDAQKNTLLKATKNPTKVIQIGLGAERTVLETVANLLNVKNK